MPAQNCPCGSQKELASCCGRYLNGDLAPDPESLMRSRYTAFCLGDWTYLKKTWHPETCPDDLGEDEPSHWVKLEILDADFEDDEGEVEFKAYLLHGNKLEVLHEVSQFEKVDGAWVYHSGEFQNEGNNVFKIAKSDPCPCGSGKQFKNCHAE